MILTDNIIEMLISRNPYRVLGVSANASQKEIDANINKFKSFLKVCKDVSGGYDYIPGLPSVDRSIDLLISAKKALELPLDRLKWTLFWFLDQTPFDKIAFNHLTSGNIRKAIEIWTKVDNLSSSLNRLTAYTILKDWEHVAKSAYALLSNPNYVAEICKIVSDTLQFDSFKLMRFYLETLSKESPSTLMSIYRSLDLFIESITKAIWNSEVREVLGAYLIKKTEDQLEKIKSIPKGNFSERAGGILELLKTVDWKTLQGVVGKGIELSLLKDKVASVGIQIAIELYNQSDEPSKVARLSLELAQRSLNTSKKGSQVYQRCEDNFKILEDICSDLPPVEVDYYDSLLNSRIEAYEKEPSTIRHALNYIKDCAPYLMSIRKIVGEAHSYYINQSTRIARAVLDDVIDDYNKLSSDILARIKNVSPWEKKKLIEELQSLVTDAVTALYQLTFFGLDDDFKAKRFQKNYNILKQQAIDSGAITPLESGKSTVRYINGKYQSCSKFEDFLPELDTRDEDAYFNTCKTVEDCNNYLHIFPEGKYSARIPSKIEEIKYNDCHTLEELDEFAHNYPDTKFDMELKREHIIFNSCKSANDYKRYLAKYPSGMYAKRANERIDDLCFANCNERLDYHRYLGDFPKGRHRLEAARNIDDLDFKGCRTIEDFETYLKLHPHGCHVHEAKTLLDDLTFKSCSSEQEYSEYLRIYPSGKHVSKVNEILEDYRFWQNCVIENSRKLYKEYVARFPNGIYRKEADKNLKRWWRGDIKKISDNKYTSIGVVVMIGIILTVALVWDTVYNHYDRNQKAKVAFEEVMNTGDIDQIISFLNAYEDTKWADEGYALLSEKCTGLGWKETIEKAAKYSDKPYGTTFYLGAIVKCDSILNDSGLNYLSNSEEYAAALDALRNGSSTPLIDLIENLGWTNEDTAWDMALEYDSIDFYNTFVDLYPYSDHASEAEEIYHSDEEIYHADL